MTTSTTEATEATDAPHGGPTETTPPRPARPKRHKWLKRLAAVFVSCLVAALLCELLVLLVFGEQVKFPRHVVEAEWGLRYNEPGAHYRHKSADGAWFFKINNQGMRADEDYAYAKPAGTVRIVSLGDSFTAGYEVHEKECFGRVLERELRSKGVKAQVLNCGVSGFSNAEEVLYLERELLKYDPDVVMLSFFFNDLVDNIRTGLFALEDGKLVEKGQRYVPGGKLANFLNTSSFFNWLSGYSNAFAMAKEKLTFIVRRSIVEKHQSNLKQGPGGESGTANENASEKANEAARAEQEAKAKQEMEKQQKLAAAILERLYQTCRKKKIPLVIQSIPTRHGMHDVFPTQFFDTKRPGVHYLPTNTFLQPLQKTTKVYNLRSHSHWTAPAHAASGQALAELMLREKLVMKK